MKVIVVRFVCVRCEHDVENMTFVQVAGELCQYPGFFVGGLVGARGLAASPVKIVEDIQGVSALSPKAPNVDGAGKAVLAFLCGRYFFISFFCRATLSAGGFFGAGFGRFCQGAIGGVIFNLRDAQGFCMASGFHQGKDEPTIHYRIYLSFSRIQGGEANAVHGTREQHGRIHQRCFKARSLEWNFVPRELL